MTLEGAINLNETNDYVVYTMNSVTTGQYGVVVPKNINGTLNMLVDLHMKGSFDSVGNGTKTKDQLVEEISSEYSKLKTKYVDGMLVMPMNDENLFQSAVLNGDKQKMIDEVKKISAITSELYKKLTDSGVERQKIDQKIIIVEKNQEDEKFVAWLKEQTQMANFVDGVLYSELNVVQEVVNPFVNNNSIFGPVQEVTPMVEEPVVSTPVSGGIFDNVPSVAPVAPVVEPVVPVAPVEPVVTAPVENVIPVVETPVNPNPTPVPTVDLFSSSSAQEVKNNETVSTPTSNIASQNTTIVETPSISAPVVEGPKPVESSMLEGTIAFTPIPNHPNNPVEPVASEQVDDVAKNNNKGFVNLAILLAVLVGVTLISIELGKYLYSVYGA